MKTKLLLKNKNPSCSKTTVGNIDSYILGVLRVCEFLSKKFDEPTMAANIIRDELVVSGFCSLKYAKQLAKSEDVALTKVWKESCLRGLS
ncbi:MAG: hypothetical protein KatS3mg035_1004 [Bacteroidia bacterium]|nr:MAG: hypothetical protein KatS3mg035_1004 [Bacteroidia bacterium]